MNNEEIFRGFIAARSRLDPEELTGYLCEDGIYHNTLGTALSVLPVRV